MKASAPGKLVLSGAYAVLRGAPAVVTAVDRRVHVDTEAPPAFEAKEVLALLEQLWPAGPRPRVPAADARELRHGGGKLGLGSSAAITVASLRALRPELPLDAVFETALRAHRTAQGGGSGVDVLASTYGGTWLARLDGGGLERVAVELPPKLEFEVWALPSPAVTSDFVRRVFLLEERRRDEFVRLFDAQRAASEEAASALLRRAAAPFVEALRAQFDALDALGAAAEVPIVTAEMSELARLVEPDAVVLPAGAGGGDIVVHVGSRPSSPAFRALAARHHLFELDVSLDAPGVRLEGSESLPERSRR